MPTIQGTYDFRSILRKIRKDAVKARRRSGANGFVFPQCFIGERPKKTAPKLPIAPWDQYLKWDELPEILQDTVSRSAAKAGFFPEMPPQARYIFQRQGNFTIAMVVAPGGRIFSGVTKLNAGMDTDVPGRGQIYAVVAAFNHGVAVDISPE